MRYLKSIIKKTLWYLTDIWSVATRKDQIPVKYFSRRKNVGDALNPYLISKITNKEVYEIKTDLVSHVLGIGSVFHFSSPKSIVWGSGIIHPNATPDLQVLRKLKIAALRGMKTRDLLSDKGLDVHTCPLGDPAVLMPLFYIPALPKKFRVGIVPHYVDQDHDFIRKSAGQAGVTIIDVADSPENFVKRIFECEVVVSSSLHGLILSDAYGIPNVWIVLSEKLIGGDFKFIDYYSTTDNRQPSPLRLEAARDVDQVMNEVLSRAKVSSYRFDKQELLNAFPTQFQN